MTGDRNDPAVTDPTAADRMRRYRARQAGENVPRMKPGPKPRGQPAAAPDASLSPGDAVTRVLDLLDYLALSWPTERGTAYRDAHIMVRQASGTDWQPSPHLASQPGRGPVRDFALSLWRALGSAADYRTRQDVIDQAERLLLEAVNDTYSMAADFYQWERDEALREAAQAEARARADHDDEITRVQPARGTRELLRQLGALSGELLKRDPYTFARRVRKADIAEMRAEVAAAFTGEHEDWRDQAIEMLDQREY